MILFFSVTDNAYVDIVYSLQKEENHVENPMAQLLTAGKRGVVCFHMAEKRPTKKMNIDEHEVTRSYNFLRSQIWFEVVMSPIYGSDMVKLWLPTCPEPTQ